MRNKIMAISMILAFLMILCVHSVAAQNVTMYAWTQKRQYAPGETGKLYITIQNNLPDTDVIIKNITIIYTNWLGYIVDHWEGNATFTNIDEICKMKGGVFNKEIDFTVPTDGRGVTTSVAITVTTDKTFPLSPVSSVSIRVSGPSTLLAIEDLNTWMTYLIAAVVVCTIILAIVFLFALPKGRARSAFVPRVLPPAPSKAKA